MTRALSVLSRFSSGYILGATAFLAVVCAIAAVCAVVLRRHGSEKAKDAVTVTLFVLIATGLFIYWPWKVAALISLPICCCVVADILKRRGVIPGDSK
jgi:hypothetical protein